ncbi:MAG: hypothetical protein QW279_02025 [Candidatus Jordarchaeaceae archaeon]
MSREEAERVVGILLTADGGCEYCVSSLLELFCENLPQFKELAQEAFIKRVQHETRGLKKRKSALLIFIKTAQD